MNILTADTSSTSLSICVHVDGRFYEINSLDALKHNERLLPGIHDILTQYNLTIHSIDALGVTAGPGSFTGIRIGIATFKSLAFSLQKPLYTFNTLDILAQNFQTPDIVTIPLLDARKKQIYTALYKNGKRLTDYLDITIDELKKILKKYKEPKVFLGDGLRPFSEQLSDIKKSTILASPLWNIRSSFIAEAVLKETNESKSNHRSDPISVLPFYIRRSEAEINKKNKNAQKNSKV